MSAGHDTWMAFYVGAYTANTLHLTRAQHGSYLLLILACFKNGGWVENEDAQLAAIGKMTPKEWQAERKVLARFFEVSPERWTHVRVEEELIKAEGITEKRAGAGQAGAESRWGSDRSASRLRSERLSAARAKGTHSKREWAALVTALDGKCVKCGVHQSDLHGGILSKDHITPLYQGGSDAIDNIQPMCRNCNSSKGRDGFDYRNDAKQNWRECLAKCLADACQTPAPLPSPSQSDLPVTSTNAVAEGDRSPAPGGARALPDTAKWAERLEGYRPWEGVHVWKSAWGAAPDSAATTKLIPDGLLAEWLTKRKIAQAIQNTPETRA